jgi:hypothetical protein
MFTTDGAEWPAKPAGRRGWPAGLAECPPVASRRLTRSRDVPPEPLDGAVVPVDRGGVTG